MLEIEKFTCSICHLGFSCSPEEEMIEVEGNPSREPLIMCDECAEDFFCGGTAHQLRN